MSTSNLLLVKPQLTSILGEKIPPPSSNLFTRIIRNPKPESDHPRERHCAEMLAALLLNAPTARERICHWLSDLGKCRVNFEKVTEIRVDTESSTLGKREDLILEGRNHNGEDYGIEFIWSVEIKVGSDFHSSSPIGSSDADEKPSNELTHQVMNYDRIMAHRRAKAKAGFVLALTNMADYLPDPEILSQIWVCTTWTSLGLQLMQILGDPVLPSDDRFLCKHVLGFIVNYLWRSSEMPDAKIEFDDIALIRAMANLGKDCKARIRNLSEHFRDLAEWDQLGSGKIKFYDGLYGEWTMLGFQKFISSEGETDANIFAGIAEDSLCVWVGSPRRFQHKSGFRALLPKLKKINSLWSLAEESDDEWIDVLCCKPLTKFLDAPNQAAEMRAFVQKALGDLVAVKLLDMAK